MNIYEEMSEFEKFRKREEHILKCKHYYNCICTMKSGMAGDWHVTVGCDGKCRRMRNYDKKKGAANE